MRLIKTFNEESVPEEEKSEFLKEISVRIVVIDDNDDVALLYSNKGDFYVLPGGRMENGETPQESVIRESKEETGCNVEVLKEIGKTIQIKAKKRKIEESLCYLARVLGEKRQPDFQEEESSEGFIIFWLSIDDAKRRIGSNKVSKNLCYNYITERDLLFLEEAFVEERYGLS